MPTKSCDQPIFYVYVCFRTDGTPCYIGKGKGNRWSTTYKRTKNVYLKRIVKRCGGELPTVVLRRDLTEHQAFEIERALIAAIGRRDLGLGPLANRTDGGEGLSGHQFSRATRKIISENSSRLMREKTAEERVALATHASLSVPPEARSERARQMWAGRSKEERLKILAPSHHSKSRSVNQLKRWADRSPERRAEITSKARAMRLAKRLARRSQEQPNLDLI